MARKRKGVRNPKIKDIHVSKVCKNPSDQQRSLGKRWESMIRSLAIMTKRNPDEFKAVLAVRHGGRDDEDGRQTQLFQAGNWLPNLRLLASDPQVEKYGPEDFKVVTSTELTDSEPDSSQRRSPLVHEPRAVSTSPSDEQFDAQTPLSRLRSLIADPQPETLADDAMGMPDLPAGDDSLLARSPPSSNVAMKIHQARVDDVFEPPTSAMASPVTPVCSSRAGPAAFGLDGGSADPPSPLPLERGDEGQSAPPEIDLMEMQGSMACPSPSAVEMPACKRPVSVSNDRASRWHGQSRSSQERIQQMMRYLHHICSPIDDLRSPRYASTARLGSAPSLTNSANAEPCVVDRLSGASVGLSARLPTF